MGHSQARLPCSETNEGYYVLMQFTAGPQTVKEVERRLRVNDAVMKYITVRIDEKLKKIEKRKKQREKRAASQARSSGCRAFRCRLLAAMIRSPAMPGARRQAHPPRLTRPSPAEPVARRRR